MPWGAAIAAGGAIAGGMLSGNAAKKAASTSAKTQIRSAEIAAEAAKFKPIGVTTAFGSSKFGYDDNGDLESAGYELTPQMRAIRDQILANAQNQGLASAGRGYEGGQGLFNLGSQYLAQDPNQVAADWMSKQQGLLAPGREQALAGVRNGLFNTGRTGLAVGATSAGFGGGAGLAATNPEMAAYYNAMAQQDAMLATQAQEQGRNAVTFGSGLMSNGLSMQANSYAPFQTALGLAGNVEALGQGSYDLGTAIGAKVATAGSTVANALMTGGMGAAKTLQAANSYSPLGTALTGLSQNRQFTNGIGNWLSGMGGPSNSSMTFATPVSDTGQVYPSYNSGSYMGGTSWGE